MNKIIEKNISEKQQCSRCAAEFEIWLTNLEIDDEKKEKIADHLLAHCPVCARVSEV